MSVLERLVKAADSLTSSMDVMKDLLMEHPPEGHTLASLSDMFTHLDNTNPKDGLIALLTCMENSQRYEHNPGDRESASRIGDIVAALIAPCSRSTGNLDTDNETDEFEDTTRQSRELALYGLNIMRICTNKYSAKFSNDTIITLISFVDVWSWSKQRLENTAYYQRAPELFPWTNPQINECARCLLSKQIPQNFRTESLIVKPILQDYLRPLFSKSRPSAITASGRKAEFQNEEDTHRALRDEVKAKPWKYADHRAIAVFNWAVYKADETLVSQQWPLFVPVLLALLDDGSTRVRSMGLHIARNFFMRCPDNILHDTGLASVFEDAILPTLHFLPSLTPVDESIQLLSPAYQSLLKLATKVNARVKSGPNASHTPRSHLLDKIFRDGILSAYFHAKEHIRICQLLFVINRNLIRDMGLNAVKHLKDLIPMHCEVLTDPFASAAPELQYLAADSLNVVVRVCWPRLRGAPYQDEIINALVKCFLNSQDNQASIEQFKPTRDRLVVIATMMFKIAGDRNSLREKVLPLVAKEPLLADLFKALE